MHSEIKTTKSDNYLLCNYRFSDKTIETIKADISGFMSNREKDDIYRKFIEWQRKANEIVVLTMYAYDDIPLPKKFDTIFQYNTPSNFIHLDYTITQAVFNGWMPVSEISRGQKHICIIEFINKMPDIFLSVPLFDETLQSGIQLGFCNEANFESIKTNLLEALHTNGERTK